jgi:hypothetical protein
VEGMAYGKEGGGSFNGDVWMWMWMWMCGCGCGPHRTDAGDAGVNAAPVPVEDFATEPLRFNVQTTSCRGDRGGEREEEVGSGYKPRRQV